MSLLIGLVMALAAIVFWLLYLRLEKDVSYWHEELPKGGIVTQRVLQITVEGKNRTQIYSNWMYLRSEATSANFVVYSALFACVTAQKAGKTVA